ncbi:Gfo/Idh/MocA family protein [Amycolatopsis sacchari]|uniref:Gfo/Idh/MocA family protein n=1 Tax=Amycolatopsis sacchari TaxID=115433 RepID=UPI003EBEA155
MKNVEHSRSDRLRLIVVGCGFMGRLHARAIEESDNAVLCGLVDQNRQVAESVKSEFSAPSFSNLHEAISATAPDGAVIATPDPFHREPAETAIKAGLAVLVEKPLATSVADAEHIVKLAADRKVPLMTGHIRRFHMRYWKLAEVVSSGRLGRPLMVTTGTWGLKSLGKRVADSTNPLWHFAIHDIDTIQWLTGSTIATVDGASFTESSTGTSIFAALGTLTGNIGFQMAAGWTLPDSGMPKFDVKVHCEYGVAETVVPSDGVAIFGPDRIDYPDCQGWPSIYGTIGGALQREVEHFIDAVRNNKPFVISPEEAVAAVRAAAMIQQLSVQRKVV